jgi:hypothetical protein
MIVRFRFDVDFVNYPMEPPTKENCMKCAFKIGGNCWRSTSKICGFGRNGYFAKNRIYELPEER